MNNGLLQILVEEDSGYVKEGKDYGRSEQHSSLVVNEREQKWYWNSEQLSGGVLEYLIKVRGLSKKAATEIMDTRGKILNGSIFETTSRTEYQRPYDKLVDTFWSLGKKYREYWYTRKLTDRTIDSNRLGYFDGWYTLPVYLGNHFANFQCRRDIPEKRIKMWYKIEGWKPVLINPEILQLVDTVFVTEGPVDALLLSQEGIPAVSHTGGGGYWGVDWFLHFNKVEKIYYIMDNDEVGRVGGEKAAKALGVYRTYLYSFDDKKKGYDTGDFFKEGGTAVDFKREVEENAKSLFELGGLNERRYEGKSYRVSTAAHRRY